MKIFQNHLLPQKLEFIRAGGSYAIVLVKNPNICCKNFGITAPTVFAPSKEISIEGQGLTAVEKSSTEMQ